MMPAAKTISVNTFSVQSLLITPMFNEVRLATATGFVMESIHGPILITNRHVVTGRDNFTGAVMDKANSAIPNGLTVAHLTSLAPMRWEERHEDLYDGPDFESPRWYEHPVLGAKADVVALPLENTENVLTPPYVPNKTNGNILLGLTEPVSIVGFPFGKTVESNLAIWSTGFIASDLEASYDGLPIFLVSCHTRSGQSGSPVIAYRAGPYASSPGSITLGDSYTVRFLGVYSGRIHQNSDIGMVWKREVAEEIVRSIGWKQPKQLF